ncbi:hypothetical protein GCM10009827_116710 [Dactylosporangium maewongense]|uniref:Uncharacterized protein n=1 Tax=Dactylosporangium maewongense TaxID=634393 RepID=A0ABN2DDR2_9ACTN
MDLGQEQHPDIAAEVTQRAGQALAVLGTLGEAMARLAAEQRRHKQGREEAQTQAQQRRQEQAEKLREHSDRLAEYAARQRATHDRRLINQTLDPNWVATADLYDLATVWRTARLREQQFPEARAAAETVEEQLRDMYPRPMHLYDEAVRNGTPRTAAMRAAAEEMAHTPVMRPYGPGTRAGALCAADEPAVGRAAFDTAVADEQIRLATGIDPTDYLAELRRLGPGGDAAAEALRAALLERAGRETAHGLADAAAPDNPATKGINEHTVDGMPDNATHISAANRDTAAAQRTAAQLAGEWYPDGLNHPHAMPHDVARRAPATAVSANTAGRTAGLAR